MDLDSVPTRSAPGPSRPPTHRRRIRLAALVVAALGLALAAAACTPPASSVSSGGGLSSEMARAINQDRAANGLAPLAWDNQLASLAQGHAGEIAASGYLWHSNLAGLLNSPQMTGWRSLGENLLEGPAGTTASIAEGSWMGSAPHRANILNAGYNRVGVGVTVDGSGRVWMVALFGAR